MQCNPLSSRPSFLTVLKLTCLSFLLVFSLAACTDIGTKPWSPSSDTASQSPELNQPSIPSDGITIQSPVLPTQPQKVSLLLPLSGKGSDTGQSMLRAAQLAMFDMNASNLFELMPIDTGRGASDAMTQSLQNGANLILGPLFSSDAKEISATALQNNINVISFSTDISASSGNVFLMGFMPQAQVNTILSFSNARGMKRIALISPRDTYGDSVASSYFMFMQRYGLDSAGIIRYNSKSLPTLADLKNLKPNMDAVLIAAPAMDAHKISTTLSEAGFTSSTVKRLGTGLWDQPDATRLSGLQGAWYAASSPRLRSRFEHRYFQTYNEQPPRLASLAYDATALAVVLAKTGQGFSRSSLTNPNGFSGIDGIFRFGSDGIADRGLAILQISAGSSVIVQDAPTRFAQQ